MKTLINMTYYFLLVLFSLALLGCGKKADENKPISEVRAEVEKMNAEQLRAMAMKYKEAIMAKNDEAEKLAAKLEDIPVAELSGEKGKEMEADIDNLDKSVSALKERFEIYYNKLKEKGGDTSGLEF